MKQNKVLILLAATAITACGGSSSSNSAPVFEQNGYHLTTNEDQTATLAVVATDKNSNDVISYSLANASANASIDINTSTGEITYQPNNNFYGQDSFEISASDGEESVTVSISVSVNAVNDAPELAAQSVLVSGGEVKKGVLTATDVDSDNLSYKVTKTTSNGELTINSATGELTYKPTGLIEIADSFTIEVTDGDGGSLTKELTVNASLASNSDRAYYYYASEQSHLKRSENYIDSISNDISQGTVFNYLAVGYAEAGLAGQVERLVSKEQIVRDEIRARTLLDVSLKYNALGLLEQADEYRSQASAMYTEFVASKGISAFDQDDATFFNDLSRAYQQVGETDKAQQSLSILDLLFASALDGEGTTSALRTFFSYRNLVEEIIETWQNTGRQKDYDLAHSMTSRLHGYANLIGHRYVSNDRNGNEGKAYHSVKQVALYDVIKSFIELNDFNNAKESLHDVFALHGVVGIDENYPRIADEYAETTRVEYEYGLYGVIKEFVVLYPETSLDIYLTGFPQGSFWALFAQDDADDARLMAQVRNMADKDAALTLVKETKDPLNLRNHFTNLVAYNSSTPGGAVYLRKQGHYQAASKFLAEAVTVLKSDEYISENLRSEPFVTGQSGCVKVITELNTLYRLTNNVTYLTQAQSTLDACIAIAKQHYLEGIDGNDVEINDAIKANSRFFAYADILDISKESTLLQNNVEANLAKIDASDYSDIIDNLRVVGFSFALGGNFVEAQKYYNRAIAQLELLEQTKVIEEQGISTNEFLDYGRRSDTDYNDYLNLIEHQAGILTDYPQIKETAYQAWNSVIEKRLAKLATAADQQKLTYLPNYAAQYIRIGKYDQAIALSNDLALGIVEKESIITNVASSLSLKDDFKQSLVASVDTDGDGKANFFLETVNEDAITKAGLSLDEDSDNDGTNDADDAFPLDPSKH